MDNTPRRSKRLGKGLSALIPDINEEIDKKDIVQVKLSNIRPNKNQPRKEFDQDRIKALSNSIVLKPKHVNNYTIITGERRYRASIMAGKEEIPAVIKDIPVKDIMEIALIENLQREDLNFIEESLGYENLIKEHNFTQQQLAEKLGKNQSTIANKLRILKLPDTVKQYLVENALTERHARALLKLPNEELMMEIIQKVVKQELTVKKTEKLINDTLEALKADSEPEKKQNIKCSMGIRIYLNTLKQAYDAIKNTGIEAKYNEIDKGDYMEIVVKIPKK